MERRPGKTPLEKAPEPSLGSGVIPKERYVSSGFMEREWERLWTQVWLMGPRLQDLAQVGDYVCEEIGPESLIFVRSSEDAVRAFYNVCPHRGNRLRNPGSGRVKSFRCGYHFWEFELSGERRNIPDAEGFLQGLPEDRICLQSIRTETWGGWVWYTLNPDAESLEEYLGMIPGHLDAYRFDDQWVVNDRTIEWDCNWKTSVDAFNETYHVQAIHPQLLGMLDDVNVQVDLYERHNRYIVPFGVLSPRLSNQEAVTPGLAEMMRMAGIDSEAFSGSAGEVRARLIGAGREKADRDGIDVSELSDAQMVDDFHYLIFPNVTLNIHATGTMIFRQRPHPSDPNRMYFDLQNLTRAPSGLEPPRALHEQSRHGEVSLGLVLDQDAYNLPRVQKGMQSAGYRGLHIGHQERRIRHMHQVLDGYLFGEGDGTRLA